MSISRSKMLAASTQLLSECLNDQKERPAHHQAASSPTVYGSAQAAHGMEMPIGDAQKLGGDPKLVEPCAPPNPERLASAAEVVVDLAPQETMHRNLRLSESAVFAREAIPNGTILYTGKPLLRYRRERGQGSLGLLCGLHLLAPNVLAGLTCAMDGLWPRDDAVAARELAAFYRCDLTSATLAAQHSEHRLVIKAERNNYRGDTLLVLGDDGGVERLASSRDQEHYVFGGGSRFNHSCRPNCAWSLSANGILTIEARQAIADGDECTHSYWDERIDEMSFAPRREFIQRCGAFICQCQLCRLQASRASCWVCRKSGAQLSMCSRCRMATYCDAKCQQLDWKLHKPSCRSTTPE